MSAASHAFESASRCADALYRRDALRGLCVMRADLVRSGVRYETGERSVRQDCLEAAIHQQQRRGASGDDAEVLSCDFDELRALAARRLVTATRSWIRGGGLPSIAYDDVSAASLGSAVAFTANIVAVHTVGGEDTAALAIDLLRRYVALPDWRDPYIESSSDDSDADKRMPRGWGNISSDDDTAALRTPHRHAAAPPPSSPVTPPGPAAAVSRRSVRRIGAYTPLRGVVDDLTTAGIWAPSLVVFDAATMDADLIAASFACVRLALVAYEHSDKADDFFEIAVLGDPGAASNLMHIFEAPTVARVLALLNERYFHASTRTRPVVAGGDARRSTIALSMASATLSSLFDAVDLLHWVTAHSELPRLLAVRTTTLRVLRTAFTLFFHYAQLDVVMATAPWFSAAAISHALRELEHTMRSVPVAAHALDISDDLVGLLALLSAYDLDSSVMEPVVYVSAIDSDPHYSVVARNAIAAFHRRLMRGIMSLRAQNDGAIYDATLHSYLKKSGPEISPPEPVSAVVSSSADEWRWYTRPTQQDIAFVELYVQRRAAQMDTAAAAGGDDDDDDRNKRQRIARIRRR